MPLITGKKSEQPVKQAYLFERIRDRILKLDVGAGEVADIVAVGLNFVRFVSRHLSGSFGYTYQTRSPNIPGSSYDVNRVAGVPALPMLLPSAATRVLPVE